MKLLMHAYPPAEKGGKPVIYPTPRIFEKIKIDERRKHSKYYNYLKNLFLYSEYS
jgi:hypothetical protein